MDISSDPEKRDWTLSMRGLNFDRCIEVFAGVHISVEDGRENYGEVRQITIVHLGDRMVIIVWANHSHSRRIIGMWKANDRE